MKCVFALAVSLTVVAVCSATTCYSCVSTSKDDICYKGGSDLESSTDNERTCSSLEGDMCYSSKLASAATRGCITQAACDVAKAVADVDGYDGSYSCCSGDKCNGAESNMINLVVMSTLALVACAYNKF